MFIVADEFGYNGCGIGLDAHSQFSLSDSGWVKTIVIFGVDKSSSESSS